MKLNQLRKAELLHLVEGLLGEENIEQMLEENDKCLDCKIILRKLKKEGGRNEQNQLKAETPSGVCR